MPVARPPDMLPFVRMTRDVSTCIYYTGLDPMTKKPFTVAKNMRDRKLQRALMQFFKPANYFDVRESLLQAGRQDLIGNGCDCLIPAEGSHRGARHRANNTDHYHTVANPAKGEKPVERGVEARNPKGYRPGRTSARRHGTKNKRRGEGSGQQP